MLPFLTITLFSGSALATPVLLSKRDNAIPSSVPSYVVDYAPIVYLYSGENYYPGAMSSQLPPNTVPKINYTVTTAGPSPLTLDNLSQLDSIPGAANGDNVYLSTAQPIESNPSFIFGSRPDASGRVAGEPSCAIIVNDHGSGLVDAFYMYFYNFNYGGTYFTFTVDDHIGDWEHNMVRFKNGVPQAVWYSQHSNGEAFTYAATQKYTDGKRPIAYSANGTHANYATPGTHDHTIPNLNLPIGPIEDFTDNGTLWDPTLSAYYYTYNVSPSPVTGVQGSFAAYDNTTTPVDWLYFRGRWGDEQLLKNNSAQSCPFNIDALCKYSTGPTGPEDKQLNRTNVCPDNGNPCILRSFLTAK